MDATASAYTENGMTLKDWAWLIVLIAAIGFFYGLGVSDARVVERIVRECPVEWEG